MADGDLLRDALADGDTGDGDGVLVRDGGGDGEADTDGVGDREAETDGVTADAAAVLPDGDGETVRDGESDALGDGVRGHAEEPVVYGRGSLFR